MSKQTKTTTRKADKQEYERRVNALVNKMVQQGNLFTRSKGIAYMEETYGVGERQAVKYWEKASERVIECLDPQQVKESVGVIKSVIQPMLYILPILSGAIGDRFGYKRVRPILRITERLTQTPNI